MDKYDIEKLRHLPIESVAERLGLRVSHHKALCPFHEDSHPSLSFRTSTNTFKCFVCGAYGGTIDLAMRILNVPFLEACRWLANEGNIILTDESSKVQKVQKVQKHLDTSRYAKYFEHPFISPEAARFLYDERHIDPRVVRWCRLNSYRDKNGTEWLQIPYYDINGRLIGIQSRNLYYSRPKHFCSSAKCREMERVSRFRFPQGSQCSMYNQQILPMLRPNEQLFITEGCSDCWAMLSSGHKAIAIPSATLLKPQDLIPLRGRECHIYPDKDDAGEALYHKLLTAANDIGFCLVRHDLPEGCKDFGEAYAKQFQG